MVAVHVINDVDDKPNQDFEFPIADARSNKPLGIHSLEERQVGFFQRVIKAKIDNNNIYIAAPNEISLSLSISKKSQLKSNRIRIELFRHIESPEGKIYNAEVSTAYDYLEEIQKAIVFSYKAIESFCNEAIPDDYIYKKLNTKGIQEHYPKEQIERWISTSEKVSEILPDVLHAQSPKEEVYWSNFKNLERLRNDIVHSKSSSSIETISELFSDAVDKYLKSSLEILSFFIKQDPKNILFPLGFDNSEIDIVSVNSTDEIMREIK